MTLRAPDVIEASTRKHISDCQIPAWSPFVPDGEAIGFLLERIYKYFRS